MNKPTILLSFQKNGKNGGPYLSHQRIMKSRLNEKYNFQAIYLPRFREIIKPKVFNSLVKEIKEANAQIFHFTGLQLDGFMSLRLAKKAGIKNICAIRGSSNEAVCANKLLKALTSACEHWTLKNSDVCYAVSEYVQNWPETQRYAKSLFGHIYNFFDFSSSESYEEDRRLIREEFSIKESEIVVASSGRVTIEKGFGDIKDIILSKRVDKNVVFLIVGDGSFKSEFEKIIRARGLENRVRFTGYREDVDAILNASDIFLSCTWHETFGNSIIEGSYHSLPVIASKVGGVPEIVNDGRTGFLIEPKNIEVFINKINILASDAVMRKQLGRNGLEYVREKFNPENIERRLDELYQVVLNK